MSGERKGRAQANALRSASSILGNQIRGNGGIRVSDVFRFEGQTILVTATANLAAPTRPNRAGMQPSPQQSLTRGGYLKYAG
jgi:hypothetical protein